MEKVEEGCRKIQLPEQVDVSGKKYTHLLMREPTVREVLAANDGNQTIKEEVKFFSLLCCVSKEVIESLGYETGYIKLQEAYTSFLFPAQQKSEE